MKPIHNHLLQEFHSFDMGNLIKPQSFTIKYNGIANVLITDCFICKAFNPNLETGKHPPVIKFRGLWDTGATNSVITENVINRLGLKPTGLCKSFHVGGSEMVNTYLVNILLPNNTGVASIQVSKGVLHDADVLIGMDVITKGDFSIGNCGGKTCFTFQIPPTHTIDFVQEDNQLHHTPLVKDKLPERNDPCPCGSGKKYKNCHGK